MWWPISAYTGGGVNTLRPRQNGRHFADDKFKRIFFNENVWISIKNSLKFVPMGPINNIPALVQIMAWRRSGDKPLFEPMMVSLPTHICVTRPQWVNTLRPEAYICQWIRSWWVQVMACCTLNANQLNEPMKAYCKLDPRKQILIKIQAFSLTKMFLKIFVCKNGSHFVQASVLKGTVYKSMA